jgi:hypothetical protein
MSVRIKKLTAKFLIQTFVVLVAFLSISVLIYVYSTPIESMRKTRNGVPYFTPPVINPETGKAISVDELVRHYKGQ